MASAEQRSAGMRRMRVHEINSNESSCSPFVIGGHDNSLLSLDCVYGSLMVSLSLVVTKMAALT